MTTALTSINIIKEYFKILHSLKRNLHQNFNVKYTSITEKKNTKINVKSTLLLRKNVYLLITTKQNSTILKYFHDDFLFHKNK